MRTALILILAGALVGCGGGSSASLQAAALQGAVYEIDGQTVDLSGIRLTLVETGATATTDADGNFSFEGLDYGSYTLATGPGAVLTQSVEGEDVGEDEDGAGRPTFEISKTNGVVAIRIGIEDGRVVEWSMAHRHHRRAANRLDEPAEPVEDDLEGKIMVLSRDDRERIKVVVEGLAEGDEIEVFFKVPDDELAVFESAGSATADIEGEAAWIRDTKMGDTLPAGADSVEDLEDYLVEVRDATASDVLLTGVVPMLPEPPEPGNGNGNGKGPPSFEDRAHGKDHLVAEVEDVEGHVMISRWPAKDWQRFKLTAEGLAEGDEVVFEIEDAANPGEWIALGTRTADEEGEAKIDSKHDESGLPLGVEDVEDLVGLDLRVRRGEDVLLTGEVPELIEH